MERISGNMGKKVRSISPYESLGLEWELIREWCKLAATKNWRWKKVKNFLCNAFY